MTKQEFESKKIADQKELDRERVRTMFAAHVANGLLYAWNEARPDIRQLAMRTVKITDAILECLEQTSGGDYPDWFQ